MVAIKSKNVVSVGHRFDYELENGVLLHEREWNGECYTVKENGREITYKPVYKYQAEGIDLDNIEEDSDAWDEAFEIVGFNEF